jgi:hypothetical protein
MKYLILPILCMGMYGLPLFASDTVEVRGVTESELKKMAQVEKDHADKALASAKASRTTAEKKMKKAGDKK